jgi:N-[(2S)-2-amino-2-carboxyethyl]-L-glutamate dehydrogenase
MTGTRTANVAAPAMTIVTGAQARRHIDAGRAECAGIVRRAYLTHDTGDTVLPHSSFLRFPHQDRIIALPGYLGGEFGVAGVKWIASWPENVASGLPRASAVLLLNDPATGFPFACLEASHISATRTAGSAVLAAEVLAGSRTAAKIGFVGTGLIADHVRRFLADLNWRVGGYRLFDLDRAAAERFASRLLADGADDVRIAGDAAAVFDGCDLVVIATVAGTPHLHDPGLLAHRPVVLHLSLRDLSPELLLSAQNITDDVDHVMRENTSLCLAERVTGHRDFVAGTLADLMTGRLLRDPGRAAVFSPFGLGVLDLAVGKWVYDQAISTGGCQRIPDFH